MMKNPNILYAPACVLLSLLILFGCKKESAVKAKTTLTVTDTIRTGNVSTLDSGLFNYVAAGTGGDVYVLKGYNKNIYKIDATGNMSLFYTAPAPDDTTVTTLNCLASDSTGNLYTLAITSTTAKFIKITPSGVASTYIDGLYSYNNAGGFLAAKIDKSGNIYFSNYYGLYKATPAGSVSQLSTNAAVSFDIDNAGDLVIATANNTIVKITPAGVTSTIAGTGAVGSNDGPAATATFSNINQVTCDNKGNIFVSDYINEVNQIRVITSTSIVYTLIESSTSHADGAIDVAKISTPKSLIADASGNLYFTEFSNDPAIHNDVRKITFN